MYDIKADLNQGLIVAVCSQVEQQMDVLHKQKATQYKKTMEVKLFPFLYSLDRMELVCKTRKLELFWLWQGELHFWGIKQKQISMLEQRAAMHLGSAISTLFRLKCVKMQEQEGRRWNRRLLWKEWNVIWFRGNINNRCVLYRQMILNNIIDILSHETNMGSDAILI